MAHGARTAVNARIVYWGPEQAGVSTTLRRVFAKLRPDHRGELREVPTRIDPAMCYEVLPIKLGEVGGVDTRIEIVAVPGAAEHAPTRKQLLDRADGVVFVADARPDRIGASLESFAELRRSLADYGRSLDDVPLVIQMNRCDGAGAAGVEDLARKLGHGDAPRFETVATEGSGVLQVLSTISKSVVRSLREPAGGRERPAASLRAPAPQPAAPATPAPLPPAAASAASEWPAPVRSRRPDTATAPASREEVTGRIEPPVAPTPMRVDAANADAPAQRPDSPAPSAALRIVAAGAATCDDGRTLRLPIEVEEAGGRRIRLALAITLDIPEGGADA